MLPENYDHIRRVQHYISQMRPVFNRHALYSDETENYRSPSEPEPGDTVTIRFRTQRNNVDCVFYISGATRKPMELVESKAGFDYYSVDIEVGTEKILYYFEIQADKICCYYNELGVTRDLQEGYSFGIVPGFKTPKWAKGAVMYQIFVDRFYNGDPSNDVETGEYYYIGAPVEKVTDWNKPPAFMGVREFYGGDIQGVWDKLDYLQSLGIEVIYFNPLFVTPSNHKYDIQDYDYIDPHFCKIVKDGGQVLESGDTSNAHASKYITRVTDKENLEASNQFFADFVAEVHRRGMKVILDGVFNHCGSFNKWLDRELIYEMQSDYEKGAYVDANSPYHTFFKFLNEHNWPYNDFYDGWWGHDTLPKLNYEDSPKLLEYILSIAKKWVSPPYNVDGWRLDVAADLGHSAEYNHFFWKEFRKAVKEANPEALILAEHYGDCRSWLQGDEWDSVMNYDAFMEPITWFLTGMEKHSDEYRGDMLGNSEAMMGAIRYHDSSFFQPSKEVAMNELSNHDHSRFLTRTNHRAGRVQNLGYAAATNDVNLAVFREAVVMQMTWTGAPTVYYGDEAGVCGFTDPDNRRTYPWGQENVELIAFHQDMIRIHKTYAPIKHGSFKYLSHDYQTFSFGRFTNDEQVVVIINNDGNSRTMEVPVWLTGISRTRDVQMNRVMLTSENGYNVGVLPVQVTAGIFEAEMPPFSAMVLAHKNEV
ncbi:MAG: glycoside hydrolase family 13 protein [Lachnospiraceae bacterium]|nr:glycoside hydrolase family 13 protein [Lachnospiraceae bacterium]